MISDTYEEMFYFFFFQRLVWFVGYDVGIEGHPYHLTCWVLARSSERDLIAKDLRKPLKTEEMIQFQGDMFQLAWFNHQLTTVDGSEIPFPTTVWMYKTL